MNIEIANRLVELRKKSGLSQEELAAKLGLSRQAVSKWERAEASPDTDNLICLAKLYGVSLDDLLNTDDSVEEIVAQQPAFEEKPAGYRRSGRFEVRSQCEEGEIVIVKEDDEDDDDSRFTDYIATINGQKTHVERTDDCFVVEPLKVKKRNDVYKTVNAIVSSICVFGSLTAYVVCGCLLSDKIPHVWSSWWVFFMSVVMASGIMEFMRTKRIASLAAFFVGASVATFILLGFYLDAWMYAWPVFLSIPLVGGVGGNIDKLTHEWRTKGFYKVPLN